MKKTHSLLIVFCIISLCLKAQTKYYSADSFPVLGKISKETETRYERLPASLKNQTRIPVWNLGKNSTGLSVRFSTNSTSISAKWEVLKDVSMNHMAPTGIKGLDLYVWENNEWKYVKTARPTGKINEQTIVENMPPSNREFLLFLPLYDGIISLFIGVDSSATIQHPTLKFPKIENPIVVYGTSITQGGCATRPGMMYTNILTRWLNTEFINLGFSGNGKLDYEIAELMAKKQNTSLFILDFVPNNAPNEIAEKTIPFVEIIRKSNPKIPILIIESVMYPYSNFDKNTHQNLLRKNETLHAQYELLINSGYDDIYYLNSQNLIGSDGEGTVDGTHFTDLGYYRFSQNLQAKIEMILPNLRQ